jgi:hypothetical protein
MNRLLRSGAAVSPAPPVAQVAHHRCLAIAAGMALATAVASALTEYSTDASKTWATRCDSAPAAEVVLGDNPAPVESSLPLAWFDSFILSTCITDVLPQFSSEISPFIMLVR